MDDLLSDLLDDLAVEHADLDRLVADLDDAGWATPTPAEGWTVLDQIAHLTFFDGAATQAATDPAGFEQAAADALADPAEFMAAPGRRAREIGGAALLGEWRAGREAMLVAFAPLDPTQRLPWYGPPMSARSFATARLMETWAHGQDVADALGVERTPTDRLRHVCHIGVRARPFSYANRGLPVPDGDVRVELTGPGGDRWAWGDEGAADRVTGSALDFCLLVTQRRHRDDTDVAAEGPLAEEWLGIAQAFAGPPGPGRPPGRTVR